MDIFEAIKQRHSIRVYQRREVEAEKLQRILEAINAAPSAGNCQAYEVVLVRDAERKQRLVKAAWDQTFIAEASVVLVFLAAPDRNHARYATRGAELYCVQDATIACAYAELAATALGLSCCWVGAYDDAAVAAAVGATGTLRPVAVLPIGYAAEQPPARARRALSDLVHGEVVGSKQS
ncbi:MAG: nitroreductase [Verrucomicrobia bacterium GWF2_62_7]|nr:MAG: nitroreductase [Verrucomicrobia bacterium GWF2_62_7]